MLKYEFEVVEKGQYAYILWPWTEAAQFLYDARQLGAWYELDKPGSRLFPRSAWFEIVPIAKTHGERQHGLWFGPTEWGRRVYRRFGARESHYLTQHGLDGIPKALWDAAYEYEPGAPIDECQFTFRVTTRKGAFDLTFFDWVSYFSSGRNDRISDLGIEIKRR